MKKKPNNPPAFPFERTQEGRFGVNTTVNEDGMTLRDYFAAKAMQGDINELNPTLSISDEVLQDYAKLYYRIADAMLKEREKL